MALQFLGYELVGSSVGAFKHIFASFYSHFHKYLLETLQKCFFYCLPLSRLQDVTSINVGDLVLRFRTPRLSDFSVDAWKWKLNRKNHQIKLKGELKDDCLEGFAGISLSLSHLGHQPAASQRYVSSAYKFLLEADKNFAQRLSQIAPS